jgi:hypothetical protein
MRQEDFGEVLGYIFLTYIACISYLTIPYHTYHCAYIYTPFLGFLSISTTTTTSTSTGTTTTTTTTTREKETEIVRERERERGK